MKSCQVLKQAVIHEGLFNDFYHLKWAAGDGAVDVLVFGRYILRWWNGWRTRIADPGTHTANPSFWVQYVGGLQHLCKPYPQRHLPVHTTLLLYYSQRPGSELTSLASTSQGLIDESANLISQCGNLLCRQPCKTQNIFCPALVYMTNK